MLLIFLGTISGRCRCPSLVCSSLEKVCLTQLSAWKMADKKIIFLMSHRWILGLLQLIYANSGLLIGWRVELDLDCWERERLVLVSNAVSPAYRTAPLPLIWSQNEVAAENSCWKKAKPTLPQASGAWACLFVYAGERSVLGWMGLWGFSWVWGGRARSGSFEYIQPYPKMAMTIGEEKIHARKPQRCASSALPS